MTEIDAPAVNRNPTLSDDQWDSLLRTRATQPSAVARAYAARKRPSRVLSDRGTLFLVAAELIASSMGLGFLVTDSANNGRVDRILLALVTLAVLGKLTDALIGVVEKGLLRRW